MDKCFKPGSSFNLRSGPRHAIKEKLIALICDWVYNQQCRLSHDINVTFTFNILFNYVFELVIKIRLPYHYFEFKNLITIKYHL